MSGGLNPVMEQMFLKMMSQRTGASVEELQSASRMGPTALAAKLGINLPSGILDVPVVEDRDSQPDPPPRPQRGRMDAITRHIATLDARLGELEQAHSTAMTMLHRVAATLGACPSCFGYDPDCDDCLGQGAPGHVASAHPRTLRRWLGAFVRQPPNPSPPSANANE